MDEQKVPRRASKTEHREKLLQQVSDWIASGISPEVAIYEKLTPRQYDTLIDAGVNFDCYLLTAEQQNAQREVRRMDRTPREGGYNKKYPAEKKVIYEALTQTVIAQGAKVLPLKKDNYRDLIFDLDGERYQIVFSKGGKTAENLIK